MSTHKQPPVPALAVSMKRGQEGTAIVVHSVGRPPSLSALLPALQNMGLRVYGQERLGDEPGNCALWLEPDSGDRLLRVADSEALCEFLRRLFVGEIEDGRLNGLAVVAGCNAQEVLLVRAAASYLRQAGLHLSLRYIAERLRQHPAAVRAWLALFAARFDPAGEAGRDDRVTEAATALEQAQARIDDTDTFDLMTWLRELAFGIVRTNYFRFDPRGPLPAYLAFKMDGAKLGFLPAPRPFRETFVFSERFEGVHLRGGPVARGGLRWSDRREDYRTEVLGLVKAQLAKNAVIVPTGAKGGFVCKLIAPDASRDAVAQEGREAYRMFISGLLDLTDNQSAQGEVVAPAGVVCHDAPDPYLVVAADKGTATFSDLANQVAIERGFWLGDAFASGGSVGYDHKKLGITAKGAWETAKVRFQEEGIDWAVDAFTAAGIGDMSGDVFGNGTLLMPTMRLVAAFDHRHIFVDPLPDVQASLQERRRLFALERSSWDDYDRQVISAGGGVWSRAERSITLSVQAQAALGVQASEMAPDQLIRAILGAPVKVLYNGGIGTYVKATQETHEAARDRSNDRTRIDAGQVRAGIIVEGGNLGLTQAARIELAQRGVRVFTDAVDNSGGVDCSDHEVNIKIALSLQALDAEERKRILGELAGEVERAVLATNRDQARRLTRHLARPRALAEPSKYLQSLSECTGLDRALEGLPDDDELAGRANHELLAPELAVVMAHAKMALKSAWVREAPGEMALWHRAALSRYFPMPLRAMPLQRHPLARQIIATQLANDVVDRMGIGAIERIAHEHQCAVSAVMDAYAFGWSALRLDALALRDESFLRMTRTERHRCEEDIECALERMVACVLENPDVKQAQFWQELRSVVEQSSAVPHEARDASAAVRERVDSLANLARALPLLEYGLEVEAAVALLHAVEQETSLNEVSRGLVEQDMGDNVVFAKWVQRVFSLLGLRVAAVAHSLRSVSDAEASLVGLALERLGWAQPLNRLRAIYKTEWGQRRLDQVLGIVSKLDEERLLAKIARDVVA